MDLLKELGRENPFQIKVATLYPRGAEVKT
jgi:hypothetical protein